MKKNKKFPHSIQGDGMLDFVSVPDTKDWDLGKNPNDFRIDMFWKKSKNGKVKFLGSEVTFFKPTKKKKYAEKDYYKFTLNRPVGNF